MEKSTVGIRVRGFNRIQGLKKAAPPKKPYTGWINDLETNTHGGECCGREHLFAFDCIEDEYYDRNDNECKLTFRDRVAGLREFIQDNFPRNRYGKEGSGLCVEAVINNQQTKDWARPLTTVGFKRVFSFVNQNSGNTCYVYLLDTSKLK